MNFPFEPPESSGGDNQPKSASDKRFERVFTALFSLVMLGLLGLEIFWEVSPGKMAMVWFFVAWVLLTTLHEIAHAVTARTVGWRVIGLRVGLGPVVSRGVIFDVPVEWRLFPIVGLVEVLPQDLKSPRLKNALIYAAGPGIELIFAGILVIALGWDVMMSETDSYAIAGLQAAALAAVFGAGLNLMPFSPQPGVVTDGLGILLSPFLTDEHFKRLMVQPILEQADDHLRSDNPQAAKKVFDEVITNMPQLTEAHLGLAKAQADLGHGEFALIELRRHVDELPENKRAEGDAALDSLRDYMRSKR